MVSFTYIDQSRIGFPVTCTLIIIFKVKTGDEDFDRKRSLHYISFRESRGNQIELEFLGVINYGISEICFANIVLQKHFLPDPCLIDKGTAVLGQKI